MTKEELKQKAEEWLCNNLHSASEEDFIKAMVDIAEPREKRIAELEATNKKISDECHKLVDSLEKKQNENELLETQNIKLQAEVSRLTIKNTELKEQQFSLRNERNTFLAQNEQYEKDLINFNDNLTKAKEIISEWEDSFCCGADYLYLGNKGKELRSKSQKFLNSEVVK